MNSPIRFLFVVLALIPAALFAGDASKNCGCACCKGKEVCCCNEEEKPAPAAEARHPLRGVVREVDAAAGTLVVKHEEIKGYMKAMTMVFKVDAKVVAAVKPGDAITAVLVHREEFWLEDVNVVK